MIAVYGGSAGGGKTFAILMEPLRHVSLKDFYCVIFRRTSPEITNPGGLWDESYKLYPQLKAKPRQTDLKWAFPSGSSIRFAHMEHEKDAHNWQGSQVPLICLQEDMPIVMGNGSTKPVRSVVEGDSVMTLEGPRRVLWKGTRRKENCVIATVYDEYNNVVGQQTQSDTHKVLTPQGWKSYADIADEPHHASSSLSKQDLRAHKYAAQFASKFRTAPRPLDTHKADQTQLYESFQSHEDRQSSSGFCACEGQQAQENDCEASAYELLGKPPLASVNVPVVRYVPTPRSSVPFEQVHVHESEVSYGHAETSLQDCLGNCSTGFHLCDELFHGEKELDRVHLQRQDGAEARTPTSCSSDALDKIRTHNRLFQRYTHPYREDVRQVRVETGYGTCDLTPCDDEWVIDLTIEDVSHYCTPCGLVNQNCFDELTHFSESQFFYMLSRNRSVSDVKPYVRATCNPDATSWVKEFLAPWLDKTYPLRAKSGEILYMVRDNGIIHWYRTFEEATLEHSTLWTDIIRPANVIKSVTFIAATIYDNKILLQQNPEYLGNLMALPAVERARLLDGDWDALPEAGKVLNREWFGVVEALPPYNDDWEINSQLPRGHTVRFWDFAATEKKTRGGDPDWTVGTKLVKIAGDGYYIKDIVRGRWNAAELDRIVKTTAHQDGSLCAVRWEEEGGSSGKIAGNHFVNLLDGFDARAVRPQGDKVKRALPFGAQAEAGNVKIMRAPWNDAFLVEAHHFPDTKHDDQVDSCSAAYLYLLTNAADVTYGPVIW